MAERPDPRDTQMDATALWREEVYTDRKVGTIRALEPVGADGQPDVGRKPIYVGEAQIMTSMGPLPVTFEIEAVTLAEAVSKYGPTAQVAVERTVKELQDLRRQAASGLVIPQGAGGGMGGGFGPGGVPGGKIQLP
ncbi:MAG TPA: hypothetical protein VEN28_13115 [Burkholderiaceae bacterium]|nr:hypothetical protein [Burkholderiaceae bacterium]